MKVNISLAGKELTAYVEFKDGGAKSCYYCKKPGKEQLVTLESLEKDYASVGIRTKLFKKTQTKLQQEFLHHRGVCNLDPSSKCGKKFLRDQRTVSEDLEWGSL